MAKKKKQTDSATTKAANFEDSYAEVESIVRKLEQGQLGLSESLKHYEKGVKHLQQCYLALEQTERRIELLTGIDKKGNARTVTFDESDDAAPEPTSKASPDSEGEDSGPSASLFDDLDD